MNRVHTCQYAIMALACVIQVQAQQSGPITTEQPNEIRCSGGGSTCKTGFVPKFSSSGGSAEVNNSTIFQTAKGNVSVGTSFPLLNAGFESFTPRSSDIAIYGIATSANTMIGPPSPAGLADDSSSNFGILGLSDQSQAVTGVSADALGVGIPTAFFDNSQSFTTDPVVETFGFTVGGICIIDTGGDVSCSGTKSAVVPVDDDTRKVALYAEEAPQNWFEDVGTGTLYAGAAVVNLEPTFAQTVNTSKDYHLFVTPNGDCKGLYVTQKTERSFVVHELGGGTSNIAFDYRVMALRRGYEDVRLADRTKQFQKPPSLFGWPSH